MNVNSTVKALEPNELMAGQANRWVPRHIWKFIRQDNRRVNGRLVG